MQPAEDRPHEPPLSSTGHPLPRRSSPENSITLRHHQLAHDNSLLKANRGPGPPDQGNQDASSPRRASSGESHETGQSDAKKWFNQSNQNPTATFDSNAMDVDPPFFQKESDSSNEDKPYQFQPALPRLQSKARSSSADDYRSVIDDLTVEIQKLKEELKRYRQHGPDMLRKDKLFEIKIHGLPKRKKRELEATLRDFTASLGDSPDTSSSQRSKSQSKHASSSSGSHTRPVDSAYASMSTGAGSSGTSLNRPQGGSRFKTNDQKVENYLREIPEGLYPRFVAMTEKEKKKLVVRRLEQIFTGKIGAQAISGNPSPQRSSLEHQSGHTGKKSRSQDMGSASNSNEDQTESGGNGNSSGNGNGNGSGTNTSPPMPPPPEQRPTRPRDLDPDRVQIPSENMEYIRHLGLVPPELLSNPPERSTDDVRPDEDGWVYLNLLCNMAQLHIMNVTPDFVRNAVVDLSAKFQLSPDGRKIRWRGGTDGTKFSSDSSGDHSQRSPETDDTDTKADHHKRQKTGHSTGDSGSSGNNLSKFGPQVSASSESFHYKPLFLHQQSPHEQSSMEDGTLSSFGPIEESNADSRWGQSGSGASNRRKRRRDGAIIYYSGAPFCTDLSGDPGDISPTTYMLSSGRERLDPQVQFVRPIPYRSGSGSSMTRRPLSDANLDLGSVPKLDVSDGVSMPELVTDSGDESSDISMEFPWSDAQQILEVRPLEPCGLGGVLPEDHFMVVVTTRRSKLDAYVGQSSVGQPKLSEETTDHIINRLATMSTSSPRLSVRRLPKMDDLSKVKIEYLSGRIKRLNPVPLPPPAIFFPPFSTGSWSEDEFGSDGDDEFNSSEGLMSRRANPHESDDYPDGVDLSSGDEDGEEPDDDIDMTRNEGRDNSLDDISQQGLGRVPLGSRGSTEAVPGTIRGRSKSASAEAVLRAGGSSAATAGGIESDYSSSSKKSG
ncbi:frequency clock protein domain-containing protein [Trichoderma breve]|uniref:Frequency clock protein domain-containing protein n=1 Tax=Trichoderma breve TaxID=2034170 RepID=A0A9W9BGD7_9HYPO|nr:frequency clock protein domain-containing protein [Trichoderma breve]KAJ4861962.1 frequency clock protein domain-containing protein [Trichoderma breve]